MTERVVDVAGNPLSIKDIVIYCIVYDRTSRLKFGVVSNVIGGPDQRITTIGYTKDWRGDGWSRKKGTSSWCSLKMLKIGIESVPLELRRILYNEIEQLETGNE